MKLTLKRTLVAAGVGIAAVVTPLSLTAALTGVSKAPGTVAGATGATSSPDQILYGQTTGTPSTFYQYLPGTGTTPPPQTVTPKNGNCGTPTVSDPNGPILSITAKLYAPSPNSNYYANASSPATVGTSTQSTGVCDISPAWSLENKSGKGAEALDFSPGPDTAVIGPNRVFTEAAFPIQRKDSGVAQPGAAKVGLVEFDASGKQVASQTCTINGGQGASITADTNPTALDTAGNCTGTTASFFQTVEVQNLITSTSLSVVGPDATFTLGSEVCGRQTIQSTGPVSATLTVNAAPSVCKSYTSFSSGPNASGQDTLMFNGFSAGAIPFTVNITWPAVPLCQPDFQNHQDPISVPVPSNLALPICAPHEFSFDNVTYYDQAYCQTPQPPGPGIAPEQELCTANKSYNNVTVNPDGSVTPITTASNAPGTQITETWVGDIDWWAK
jgi:hypothetical protein